jgi:predicted glycoside hydrolase/deacetylase ChbG (UPF0249 family)
MKRVAIALAILACGGAAGQAPRTVQERLGHPAGARLLIIHADDLGMSHSVNRATFEALQKGWITSASILVPCPWFPEVARFAREHPDLDLGIHLALNSEWTTFRWGPLNPPQAVNSLVDEHGYFPLVEPAVTARAKPDEVARELEAQIDRAQAAGVRLSHLDSHMATLFRSASLFNVYRGMGQKYRLPILLERDGDRTAWTTEAQAEALLDRVLSIDPGVSAADWRATYEKMLAPLKPGVYQLIVHLGYDDEEMRGATADHPDWGAAWRQQDLDLVRSAEFQRFLRDQGFVLIKWQDLARAKSF